MLKPKVSTIPPVHLTCLHSWQHLQNRTTGNREGKVTTFLNGFLSLSCQDVAKSLSYGFHIFLYPDAFHVNSSAAKTSALPESQALRHGWRECSCHHDGCGKQNVPQHFGYRTQTQTQTPDCTHKGSNYPRFRKNWFAQQRTLFQRTIQRFPKALLDAH